MIVPYALRLILALSIALSCYSSTFPAAEPVQDSGDDGWYGLAPIDVYPRPQYVNYGAPTPVTTDGKTFTVTSQGWAGANTQDLVTTTINGNPVTTAITQYAQFVKATTTSDGKIAVTTYMVVSPKMLDILRKAADKAISAWVAKEQNIELGLETVATLTTGFLLGELADVYLNPNNKENQFEQPVIVPITDAPSATSGSSSSAGPTVTAWIDPQYPDLDLFFYIDVEPTGPTPRAPDEVTGTSLFCSASATPSPTIVVNRDPAISHGEQFCHDTNRMIFGPGQPYNGTQEEYEGKSAYFTNWATTDQCKDKSITYTVDEDLCKRFINDIVDRCDPPAPDNYNAKHGGTVTDGCMIFELQPYVMQPVAPTPSPSTPTPSPSPTQPYPISTTSTN